MTNVGCHAFLILVAASTLLRYSPAFAAGLADQCDGALVLDTFNSTEAVKKDYRLAVLVDETTYKEIKQKFGASAVIYGSPATGTYENWKKNVDQQQNSRNESLSTDEARSVSWTHLGGEASKNYRECLRTIAGKLKNVVLLGVDKATTENVDLTVHWSPDQFGPSNVDLTWDPAELNLPPKAHATSEPVHFNIRRPSSGEKLIVVRASVAGKDITSDSIVIAAPPEPLRAKKLTWNGRGSQHTIEENLPTDAIGKSVYLDITGEAYSGGSGQIWGEVSINGEQKCASPAVTATGKLILNMSCAFKANQPNQKIKIFINNANADARSVYAEVWY